MNMTHRSLSLLLVLAGACGPTIVVPEDDDTGTTTIDEPQTTSGLTVGTTVGTTSPGTTGNPTTSTSSQTEPTTATSNDTSSDTADECGAPCCGFICPPDGGDGGDAGCDPWAQDCPEGEKCMPWSNDGEEHWDSVRCSPVETSPGLLGDPCTVEGAAWSGIDDCGLGLMCFWVDPLTLEGFCVAQCDGTEANPLCEDPNDACVVDFDGVFTLCLPACDPLLNDCVRGGCYPFGGDELLGFACGTTIQPPSANGEACEHDWDCLPGAVCPTADDDLPACEDGPCCAPLCDLTVAPDPCGPDRVCTPLVELGQRPPGGEDTGYCALP